MEIKILLEKSIKQRERQLFSRSLSQDHHIYSSEISTIILLYVRYDSHFSVACFFLHVVSSLLSFFLFFFDRVTSVDDSIALSCTRQWLNHEHQESNITSSVVLYTTEAFGIFPVTSFMYLTIWSVHMCSVSYFNKFLLEWHNITSKLFMGWARLVNSKHKFETFH